MKERFDNYKRLKESHKEHVLLFRYADWYETYGEDAKAIVKVLGITLKKRGDIYLAHFPHQELDEFLPKLVRAGVKTAICDPINKNV